MDAARNLRRTRDRLHLYRACGGEPPRNHAPDIAAMDLFVASTHDGLRRVFVGIKDDISFQPACTPS
jgi:hypothetical protein